MIHEFFKKNFSSHLTGCTYQRRHLYGVTSGGKMTTELPPFYVSLKMLISIEDFHPYLLFCWKKICLVHKINNCSLFSFSRDFPLLLKIHILICYLRSKIKVELVKQLHSCCTCLPNYNN